MHQHLVEVSWNSLLDAFGEEIEVLPRNGEAFILKALFREISVEIGPKFSETCIRSQQPHFKYRPNGKEIKVGDKVRIRGELYATEEVVPDGLGGFVFELQKVKEK